MSRIVFDGHSVSFVSVTQQFNTTTSMGRLTLNVLLSFAQFEREVTAERIRDKIAASKQKGMFMGGRVPMGYRLNDRKLEIDEAAATKVQSMYRRYIALRSVSALAREINAGKQDRTGETDAASSKVVTDMKSMSLGHLRHVLSNPTYIGKVRHKGRIYPGEHQGIVAPDVFARVQTLLSDKTREDRSGRTVPDIHLLSGLLYDETGDHLRPTHARKQARRYRYYVSHRLRNGADANKDGWRISAGELERIVLAEAQEILANKMLIATWLESGDDTHRIAEGLERAEEMVVVIQAPDPTQRKECLTTLFTSITLSPTHIRYQIDKNALRQALLPATNKSDHPEHASNQDEGHDECEDQAIVIDRPMTIKRRGMEARLVIHAGGARHPDASLVTLIARAHLYLRRLTDGSVSSIGELATILGVHRADISRILPLAFLSPGITESVLIGRQPVDLTVRTLSRLVDIPASWSEQSDLLGA